MKQITSTITKDRAYAGALLGRRLLEYARSQAVVVGIPHGGVIVASALADALSLPLWVMPCHTIRHPVDKRRSIGSVTADEAVLHDCPYDVPQDYIYHQMALLRNKIREENLLYHPQSQPVALDKKIVILVDDVLHTSDTMMASLRAVKKLQPLKIIVAVPYISVEAARAIKEEADDITFLWMRATIREDEQFYADPQNTSTANIPEMNRKKKRPLELHDS